MYIHVSTDMSGQMAEAEAASKFDDIKKSVDEKKKALGVPGGGSGRRI